jgi:tetratricopeptide (TPR) repeat protein
MDAEFPKALAALDQLSAHGLAHEDGTLLGCLVETLRTAPSERAEQWLELELYLAEEYRRAGELAKLAACLATLESRVPPDGFARATWQRHFAWLRRMQGEHVQAERLLREASSRYQRVGRDDCAALCLGEVGFALQSQGKLNEALTLHRRALVLHRARTDAVSEATELSYIAVATHRLGRMHDARILHAEALALHQASQANVRAVAAEHMHRGYVLGELGETVEGRAAYAEAIALHRERGDRLLEALSLVGLGAVYLQEAEQGAAASLELCLECVAEAENLFREGQPARLLSACALLRGHVHVARQDFTAAKRAYEEAHSPETVVGTEVLTHSYLALALAELGDPSAAAVAHIAWDRAATLENPCIKRASALVLHSLAKDIAIPTLPEHVASSDLRRITARLNTRQRVSSPTLFISPSGKAARLNDATIDLRRKASARRILLLLVARHQQEPGTPVALADVIAAGWPDERMSAEAAQKRAYTAIWALRQLGFSDVLERHDEGYLLKKELRIEIREVL